MADTILSIVVICILGYYVLEFIGFLLSKAVQGAKAAVRFVGWPATLLMIYRFLS
jgi:hypothetical protein